MKTRALILAALLAGATGSTTAQAVDPIDVCMHVPITGSSLSSRHPSRFGQFYFDYVNAELGGIGGHPVALHTFDDRSSPVGARQAMEACARIDPILYVGPTGPDEIVSIAGLAERRAVPYLHGSAPHEDLKDLTWSAFISPTTENGQTTLAHAIADNRHTLGGSTDPVIGMVIVDSPFYARDVDAFRRALEARGLTLGPVVRVQKDEQQFQSVHFQMASAGVRVINLDVTPSIALRMLSQQPPSYDPTYVSAASGVATNLVAHFAGTRRLFALNDPSPLYDPNDATLPWSTEIKTFMRIFHQYSPQHDPGPDDHDWTSYLRAKQLHRFLTAAGGDYSSEHLRSLFSSFTEVPAGSFPTCALDLASEPGIGQRAWHAFETRRGRFVQVSYCAQAGAVIDLAPPTIACAEVQVVAGRIRCDLEDEVTGAGAWSVSGTMGPIASGDIGCRPTGTIDVPVPQALDRITITASDCAFHDTSADILVVSLSE